jgi:hypothetical protein
MPERSGEELARRAGAVRVQGLDGGSGVRGGARVLEFAVFGQQVAMVITCQCPVPLAVRFGAVTQALDDLCGCGLLHPAIKA